MAKTEADIKSEARVCPSPAVLAMTRMIPNLVSLPLSTESRR